MKAKPKDFTCRRPGSNCGVCSQPISVGSRMTWDRSKRGVYYHSGCKNPAPYDAGSPGVEIPDTGEEYIPDDTPPEDYTDGPIVIDAETVPSATTPAPSSVDQALDVIRRAILDPSKAGAASKVTLAHLSALRGDFQAALVNLDTKIKGVKAAILPEVAAAATDALKKSAASIVEDASAVALDAAQSVITAGLAAVQAAVKDIGVMRIEVKAPDSTEYKIEGACHEMMERLLAYVSERRNVYAWGPPGSGKSHLSRQIAEICKLAWTYDSLVPETFESTLVGFYDANGNLVKTSYRRAYEAGGLHCLDELDNSSARLQARLNSSLANGHGSFPDGTIARHADFVCFATGNTRGRGGDPVFPERRRMDPAFLDRFLPVYIGYDNALEQRVAEGTAEARMAGCGAIGKAWAKHVQACRAYAEKKHPQIMITPRASYDGALLLAAGRSVSEVSEVALYRTWDESACSDIRSNVRPFSK